MISDPRLVRLVARHYGDLQGLRHMVVGACMGAVASAYLATRNDSVAGLALLVGFLVTIPAQLLLDRYYARTFGRTAGEHADRWWVLFGASFGILNVIDFHVFGIPSLAWVGWAGWTAWLVADCWPERRYHLLTVAAALFLVWTHIGVVSADGVLPWEARGVLLLSGVVVVTGAADHLLLMRALAPTGDGAAASPDLRGTETHERS